jgi:hypothetical protein
LTTGVISEAVEPLEERVLDDPAEAPRKGEKPLGRQLLAANEDHQIVEPGAPDRGDRAVIEIIREIDAGDLGPKRPCYPTNLDHASTNSSPVEVVNWIGYGRAPGIERARW